MVSGCKVTMMDPFLCGISSLCPSLSHSRALDGGLKLMLDSNHGLLPGSGTVNTGAHLHPHECVYVFIQIRVRTCMHAHIQTYTPLSFAPDSVGTLRAKLNRRVYWQPQGPSPNLLPPQRGLGG